MLSPQLSDGQLEPTQPALVEGAAAPRRSLVLPASHRRKRAPDLNTFD